MTAAEIDADEAGRVLLAPTTYLDGALLYRASAVLRAYPVQAILSLLGLPDKDYAHMLRLTWQLLSPVPAAARPRPGQGVSLPCRRRTTAG